MGGLGRKFLHKLPDIEILRNLESPFVLWIQIDTCFLASTSYERNIVEFLIERGADVNGKTYDGETPLFHAAWHNLRDVVELLINRGANINAQNNDGQSALFDAAGGNDARDVAELLLDLGLDVNATDNDGSTPLHNAAYFHALEVAVLLLDRGAHVNTKTTGGDTPLDIALESERDGSVEMRELLRRHGGRCAQRC